MGLRVQPIPLMVIAGLLLVTAIVLLAPDTPELGSDQAGAMVTLETYDIETGEAVTGACFSLEGELNGACDGDGSGRMTFAQPIVPGSYVVGYERTAHGHHLRVGNFPLIVTGTSDQTMQVAFVQDEDGIGEWVEVTVVAVSEEPATPGVSTEPCFTIHGAAVNEMHGDVQVCGPDSGPVVVRTGTFLLTTAACDFPVANHLWIAVTEPATIEVPVAADGCIAAPG